MRMWRYDKGITAQCPDSVFKGDLCLGMAPALVEVLPHSPSSTWLTAAHGQLMGCASPSQTLHLCHGTDLAMDLLPPIIFRCTLEVGLLKPA